MGRGSGPRDRDAACVSGRHVRQEAPGPWGRIGVSICDITAGMNALIGIQQALLERERSGRGSGVKVSLFDSAAELMTVPYLQARYGAGAPDRVGLKHPSIAPYGAFTCSDGRELVLSIQNEREWAMFCERVLRQPRIATDARFASNNVRTQNRAELEAIVQGVFAGLSYAETVDRLTEAQTAYGRDQLGARPDPASAAADAADGGQSADRADSRHALRHRVGRCDLCRGAPARRTRGGDPPGSGGDSASRGLTGVDTLAGARPDHRVGAVAVQPCQLTRVLVALTSSSASSPFSRPWPLRLVPPKGSSTPPPAP